MLPREHGAYGQIAFPTLTAFLVSDVSVAGLLIAAAVVAGFLAHEPAAVLLGLCVLFLIADLWLRGGGR